MLASRNRIRRSDDFMVAVRRGHRCGRAHLVLHLAVPPDSSELPRVGFVVSKAVGGAVVRNTVTRRLRPVLRMRLDRLPAGSLLVVRALPAAAGASSSALAADVDAALARLLDRVPDRLPR